VQAEARVFLFDMIRHVTTPLDLGRRITESVAWHPDGKRLTLGGPYLSLFDIDSGKETRLTESGRPKRVASWSPDGRVVAYMTFNPANDIHVLTLEQGAKPRPFLATDASESDPAISPDGRWIAFRSTGVGDASQRTDVYVARFPEGTSKVQITSGGGGTPFWSHDSRELFFTAPPGVLQMVRVTPGDRLEVGGAQTLFPVADLRIFGVATDGGRFLAGRMPRVDPPTDIVVVQHAFQELPRQP
jgi:Tol biopolymer transport system component